MKQLKNFADQRYNGQCVYCGAAPETREHVPPKVFLDRPFPDNLPVIEACTNCNNGFSKDEEYLACLVECVVSGSVDPEKLQRKSISNTLKRQPALQKNLNQSMVQTNDGFAFHINEDRIKKIIRKIAQGHVLFELNLRLFNEPDIFVFPITNLSEDQIQEFEDIDLKLQNLLPEVGSRAMQRLLVSERSIYCMGWVIVQPGRYRYSVQQGKRIEVRMVFSEYLACIVVWEDGI